MAKETVILIDGSSYFFRAFFAIQRLSTRAGMPTNAVYGFINMLMKVLDTEKPKKLAICFDTPKPSFRKKIYKAYKANREAPPEDLIVQIPYIQRAVDAFKIFRFQREGFEADDVIATLSAHARKKGHPVEIISGDKDLMQLVSPKVTLFDTMKEKRYDAEAVFEKFQVRPEQMVDFLALMGDSSDNVPGVSGIGKKTAADLLGTYGTLDKLYKKLSEIKQQKRRETLEKEKKQAYLSKELVTLDHEVPIDYQWKDLDYTGPDTGALQALFEELEFQNLMKRFGFESTEPSSQFKKGQYKVILDPKELKRVVQSLSKSPYLCLDTETTSLSIHDAQLVGLSLSGEPGEAYYIPVGHTTSEDPKVIESQLDSDVVKKSLKPVLEDSKIAKLGQNLKFDLQILRRWGVELEGIAADTLLGSYLIDPDQKHNLDNLAFRYLKHTNITYEEVTGKGKNQIGFDEVPIEKATHYAAEDADVTLRIHQKMLPELKEAGLFELYEDTEIPLLSILADMEYQGVHVDEKRLKKMASDLEKDLDKVQKKIHKVAGEPININSPKQLSALLFGKLKLPVVKKTKTGYSTDESVLLELSSKHEIAALILKFREWMKLKGTFVDGLLAQIHPETRKIHTSYNQTVTATGRLSSSHPNLQNIPVSGSGKYDVRSVFVPKSGSEFFSADYSQVELRLLAHLSRDKELMRAFEQDEDVHAHTGKLIFGVKKVDAEQRKIAKTINFGVIYGQTPFGLSRQLKISPGEAKSFIDSYFKRYSGVKAFMESTIEQARDDGKVTTMLGRRRFLPEIHSKNRIRREMAERTAINTPLQGSAADLIKVAMIRIDERLRKERLKSRMILQVHDELVFEVPRAEKKKMDSLVRKEMESAFQLAIPLKVSVGWGENWAECK